MRLRFPTASPKLFPITALNGVGTGNKVSKRPQTKTQAAGEDVSIAQPAHSTISPK